MGTDNLIKVQIAHADPLIAAGIAATLRQRGEFEIEPDDSEAGTADVIIADYNSALQWLLPRCALARRVLVLTHSDSETKIFHALERGAGGYLLQGCSVEELAAGVCSVFKGETALGPAVASRIAQRLTQQPLTRREEEILGQISAGLSNKAIAKQVGLAVGTVKSHVKTVLGKLGASTRTEAVSIARRRGLLDELPIGVPQAASGRSRTEKMLTAPF